MGSFTAEMAEPLNGLQSKPVTCDVDRCLHEAADLFKLSHSDS